MSDKLIMYYIKKIKWHIKNINYCLVSKTPVLLLEHISKNLKPIIKSGKI